MSCLAISIYISEVVPPKGNGLLNTWDNLNQQIITFSFPIIVNMNASFVVFGLIGIACFPILWRFVWKLKTKH